MNEAIFKALCSCLGLSPSSEQALSLIRQAYTEPENRADITVWFSVSYSKKCSPYTVYRQNDIHCSYYNENKDPPNRHFLR